jgi:anti-sigma factor RsiW
MNCVEAQKHFADLLDHSRDERLRKVNDHLAACARCRQEFAAVAACQRLVSALPPLEPPAGFTSRVMAEVREAAHRPNLWQRLFSSLQVKLPLQVTAVILISVLAVFIYRKESGQRQSITTVPPPSGLQKQAEADKLAPAASGAPALESEAQKPDASGAQERQRNPSSRSPAKPEEQSKVVGGIEPDALKAAPPPAPGNPASVVPSQPKKESSPADQAGSVRQEQSLRSGGAQAKGVPPSAPLRDNDTAARDRTSGGESRSSAGLEEKRARSSLDALSSSTASFADRDLILRLKQPARDDRNTEAASELERRQAEEKRFNDLDHGRQRAIETGKPQTVSAIIDASQYDELKKELARWGKIESEAPAPAYEIDALSKSSGQVRITVTILPPLSSAKPSSSR